MPQIPSHLQKYISEQDYSLYTHEDQAVWRFIMTHLYSFLKDHAHPCYVEGLEKTAISLERIPKISEMNEKLKEYGWAAAPVSGFIPPAAFMSFQAHRILPIACEMRSMEHILYTPAPDIVHEAAGHAPILIDPDFTEYLSSYGEVAAKAIISSEGLDLYEAIRDLSDIKEKPDSSKEEIAKAEEHLNKVSSAISYVSEAQLLGRMNWWTAEYGLIGSLDQPKIYGAGLLSSVGESRNSLKKAQHLEFGLNCLDYSYDITEQQPQLFVAKGFKELTQALKEISEQMAFKQGGPEALKKVKQAKSVCTIELSNKETYSGVLLDYKLKESSKTLESLTLAGPHLHQETLHEEQKTYDFSEEQGLKVTSAWGGPSSYDLYPEYDDFVSKKILVNKKTDPFIEELLFQTSQLRQNFDSKKFEEIKSSYLSSKKEHWLLNLELLELSKEDPELLESLNKLKTKNAGTDTAKCIELGLELL